MFSEELEDLMNAALEDGVLTEKEKQVLFKRAQAEGVDLDEFEMILDAKLAKQKKEVAAPKSDKHGVVKKCPNCGEVIQTFQGTCPACGYVFEGIEANSSAKRLAQLIEDAQNRHNENLKKIRSTPNTREGVLDKLHSHDSREIDERFRFDDEVGSIIRNFPVPNTKADLMEFILALKPKTKAEDYADDYYVKYMECLDKAKYMFSNDEDFAKILKDNKLSWWGKKTPTQRMMFIVFVVVLPLLVILGLLLENI